MSNGRSVPTTSGVCLIGPETCGVAKLGIEQVGIVVRDHTANVSFYAQDPTPTGTNPYAGPHGYFEGKTPGQLLASFPWSHLQLFKMELHSTS